MRTEQIQNPREHWCRIAILSFFATMGATWPGQIERVVGQEVTSFRDRFPHVVAEDWNAFGRELELEPGSAGAGYIDRILASVNHIPSEVWESESVPLEAAAISPPDAAAAGVAIRFEGRLQELTATGPRGIAGEDPAGVHVLVKTGDDSLVRVIPFQIPLRLIEDGKLKAEGLGQPVSGFGVLAGFAESVPVIVSPRLRWLPDRVVPELGTNEGQCVLASVAFDCGLFDSVRNFTSAPVLHDEVAAFDGLLVAAETLSRTERENRDLPVQIPEFDLIATAKDPMRNAGALSRVTGQLRRISTVAISSPKLREALGVGHYYQLDVFVPLGNQRIVLGEGDDGKPVEFSGSYGITLITTRLPDGLPAESGSLSQPIEATAFLFKVWMHPSLSTTRSSAGMKRPNPVLVAVPAQLRLRSEAGGAGWDSTWFTVTAVLFFGLIAAMLWWKGPGRFSPTTREPLPDRLDFPAVERELPARDPWAPGGGP